MKKQRKRPTIHRHTIRGVNKISLINGGIRYSVSFILRADRYNLGRFDTLEEAKKVRDDFLITMGINPVDYDGLVLPKHEYNADGPCKIYFSALEYTIVDPDDFEWASKCCWSISRSKKLRYLLRCRSIAGKRQTQYLHRLILNPPDDLYVDHINGNTLDNRKCNLRIVTHSQNLENSKGHKSKFNPSGYKGVTFLARKKRNPHLKWRVHWNKARLINGKVWPPPGQAYQWYATAEEAARAYDVLAKAFNSVYLFLNFPDEN